MKINHFSYLLILLFITACSDPCDDLKNLECETGDADMDSIINIDDIEPENPCIPNDYVECPTGDLDYDGIINSEDPHPEDKCLPNVLDVEFNIEGKWEYNNSGISIVEFKKDGTYEDIEGTIFFVDCDFESYTWSIRNNNNLIRMNTTMNGGGFEYELEIVKNQCDELMVDFGINNKVRKFTRI